MITPAESPFDPDDHFTFDEKIKPGMIRLKCNCSGLPGLQVSWVLFLSYINGSACLAVVFLYKQGVIIMKRMRILVVVDAQADLTVFQKLAGQLQDTDLQYQSDVEQVIDAAHKKDFDLLIVDKALPATDFKKLIRITDLVHSDAAIIEFNLADEEYMRFKLSGLMAKWIDAQSDSHVNFLDNPM